MGTVDYDQRYAKGQPIGNVRLPAGVRIVRIPHADGRRWIDYPVKVSQVTVKAA